MPYLFLESPIIHIFADYVTLQVDGAAGLEVLEV
jgi:hypothetical protein